MDYDSDESERWEDFFGSSTDLAPSVISYYDRLSGTHELGLFANNKLQTPLSDGCLSDKGNINTTNCSTRIKHETIEDKSDVVADIKTVINPLSCKTVECTETTTCISFNTIDDNKSVVNGIESTRSQSIYSIISETNLSKSHVNIETSPDENFIENQKIQLNGCGHHQSHIPSPFVQKHRKFTALSANVQRLIANSSSPSNATIDLNNCQTINGGVLSSPVSGRITNLNATSLSTSATLTSASASASTSASASSLPSSSVTVGKHTKRLGSGRYKHSQINIPLSRNTSKLTQSGTELVDTIDCYASYESLCNTPAINIVTKMLNAQKAAENLSSDDYDRQLESQQHTVLSGDSSINNVNNNNNSFLFNKELKKLTKSNQEPTPMSDPNRTASTIETVGENTGIECDSSNKNGNLGKTKSFLFRDIKVLLKPTNNSNSNNISTNLNNYVDNEPMLSANNKIINSETMELNDNNDCDDVMIKCHSEFNETQNKNNEKCDFNEIINKNVQFNEQIQVNNKGDLINSENGIEITTNTLEVDEQTQSSGTPSDKKLVNSILMSPKLSLHNRNKLLSNRPLPPSPKLGKKTVAEKWDNKMKELKLHPVPLNTPIDVETGTNRLEKGDLMQSKLRPLSATSICSTLSSASTSSSGSEHVVGSKNGIAYLASVESLADQSETDHNMNSHSNLTVCERACREIIDSEQSYVDDLGQVIKGYLEDWKERACLKLDELKVLFSNIQDIYEFNSQLLKRLVNSGMDPIKIAKCFIELRQEFRIYTTYCTSYPEAISLLTKLLQESHTNALLTSTQKMLQHTLPLGSYLLKPVQRILRYHLLLDNLRKHCQLTTVAEAHEMMKGVARNIDQVQKNFEQQSRVKELSGILDGWLGPELTVLGELRLEGRLMESNKPRVVLLFQTMLIVTKEKEDKRLQFKTYIHCKNIMLIEHLNGEPTSFNVIPYHDPHPIPIKLTARNRDQKRSWTQHIKQVMLDQFDCDIPSRAKELMFQLGEEDDRSTEKYSRKWGNGASFTTPPEYLERRNQYRRSELRYKSKMKKKNLAKGGSISNEDLFESSQIRILTDGSLPDGLNHKQYFCNDHKSANCPCAGVKKELNTTIGRKNKPERIRSRSEPRIPDAFISKHNTIERPSVDVNKFTDKSATPKFKDFGIKVYTTKTPPRRIVNIKKNRAKTLKETSKFYMDLPVDESNTVLKISESIDNLTTSIENLDANLKNNDKLIEDKRDALKRKDSDIILEILKEKEDFQKILKKSPKDRQQSIDRIGRKSVDNSKKLSGNDNQLISKSDEDLKMKLHSEQLMATLHQIESELHVPQPIYKTNRVISVQDRNTRNLDESNYVTLNYSPSDDKKGTKNFDDQTNSQSNSSSKRPSVCRSDSQGSYAKFDCDNESLYSNTTETDKLSMSSSKLSDKSSKSKSPCGSSGSLSFFPLNRKSVDAGALKALKTNEQKINAMDYRDIFHKQGSESLGNRIAHVDYVDPRTLLAINRSISTPAQKPDIQRDSVLSLTSSNDSDYEPKENIIGSTSTLIDQTSINDSYYEDNVEACLETDFRDSAVYSDDNDKKSENNSGNNSTDSKNSSAETLSAVPLKPAVPRKPIRSTGSLSPIRKFTNQLSVPVQKCTTNEKSITSSNNDDGKRTSLCNGWVLQQIKNFEK